MTRPSREESLMEMAKVVSRRSTCSRAQVGVVIARDARILTTGYNGVPAGLSHCSHECDCRYIDGAHAGYCASDKPCHNAVHAEANAIAYAARHGVSVEGCDLYTTLSPCRPCSQLIVAAGIQRVFYSISYRDPVGVEYLVMSKIRVYNFEGWKSWYESFASSDEA